MSKRVICLDVGCGAGVRYGFNPRCPKYTEAVLLDVDFPSSSVRRFISLVPSLHFIVADAEKLPIRSELIDLAYMWHVLEHVVNTVDAVSELVRVLKRGGVAHVAVPNFLSVNATRDPDHKHIFTPYKLWKLLKRGGCKHITFLARLGSRLPRLVRLILLVVLSYLSEEIVAICVK